VTVLDHQHRTPGQLALVVVVHLFELLIPLLFPIFYILNDIHPMFSFFFWLNQEIPDLLLLQSVQRPKRKKKQSGSE
jgi:hypothetical protein